MPRRKEHRWVKVQREPTGDFVIRSLGRGEFTVYATYRVKYRQNVTGFTRYEEERSVELRTILNEMNLSDRDYGIIYMLHGGLVVFTKLVEQWEWKQRQKREKEAAAREETRLARKRAKLVKDRQFGRVLEI